jgi:hypothetical protein
MHSSLPDWLERGTDPRLRNNGDVEVLSPKIEVSSFPSRTSHKSAEAAKPVLWAEDLEEFYSRDELEEDSESENDTSSEGTISEGEKQRMDESIVQNSSEESESEGSTLQDSDP